MLMKKDICWCLYQTSEDRPTLFFEIIQRMGKGFEQETLKPYPLKENNKKEEH